MVTVDLLNGGTDQGNALCCFARVVPESVRSDGGAERVRRGLQAVTHLGQFSCCEVDALLLCRGALALVVGAFLLVVGALAQPFELLRHLLNGPGQIC